MKKIEKKILIVEDDESFRSMLKAKLASEVFSVVEAKNGQEGIDVKEREKPDLIITDILMPKMDGIEMVKKMQESDKNLSIIFLTNIQDDDRVKEIKKSQNFLYLIKSDLSISEIAEKVKNKLA